MLFLFPLSVEGIYHWTFFFGSESRIRKAKVQNPEKHMEVIRFSLPRLATIGSGPAARRPPAPPRFGSKAPAFRWLRRLPWRQRGQPRTELRAPWPRFCVYLFFVIFPCPGCSVVPLFFLPLLGGKGHPLKSTNKKGCRFFFPWPLGI